MSTNKPKLIEELTLDDLMAHRWCFYQTDDEDFDDFEYVVPDSHPAFSLDIVELELAEFTFANGKVAHGIYDGWESFNIMTEDQWYSFWYGVDQPEPAEVERIASFLSSNDYQLPVKVSAKWSKTIKEYNGLQYMTDDESIVEVAL